MLKNNNYCILLAGGNGTKLWPVSRLSHPKQFLDLSTTGKTLLRHSFERFLDIIPIENIIIVSSEKFASIIQEQIPELPPKNILLEPYSRNTAPSIAYATYTILKRCPTAKIVVSPSDNHIESKEEFCKIVTNVLDFVNENDYLVTLGVEPNRADTSYGYIQVKGGKNAIKSDKPLKVKTFTEKPDKELAKVFLESGEFLWNSGVIIAHADTIRREMENNNPEVTRLFAGWEGALGTEFEKDFIYKTYTDCTTTSFDYSILERTNKTWVQPCHFGWMDIGNWGSIYGIYPNKDEQENAFSNEAHIAKSTNNSLFLSTNPKKLIAAKGLENYIVIDTDDALLICPKTEADFNDLISELGMPQYEDFR